MAFDPLSRLRSERWISVNGNGARSSFGGPGRRLRVVAVAIAAVVVQHGLMPDLTIFGVHPDILLLLTVVVGITGGADRGAVAGFAAGLATDIFLTTPLGLSAMAYAIAGYLIGLAAVDADDLPWTIGGFAALGTAVGVTLYVVLAGLLSDFSTGSGRWLQVTFILAILNSLLAPLLAPVLARSWRSRRPASW